MYSVVIPLYNKAHTIKSTLQTVLQQTYPNFEVIIVNDGSTDNGIEVVKNFTHDERIRIITQANHGVSSARNTGVQHSIYNYIAFLDGDDEWLPTYLETMRVSIIKYPQAGMYCCAGVVRNANGTESLRLAHKYKDSITKIDFFENPGVFLHTSATIVSKSVFYLTKGFPVGIKKNEDFALFFNIALISDVIYCGKPLSVYVGGIQGQATQSSLDLVIYDIIERYNYVHDIWERTDQSKKTYIVYTKYELRHLFLSFIRKDDFDSIKLFLKKINPSLLKLFNPFECFIYKKPWLKLISTTYILFTKVIWRYHGFPVVRN